MKYTKYTKITKYTKYKRYIKYTEYTKYLKYTKYIKHTQVIYIHPKIKYIFVKFNNVYFRNFEMSKTCFSYL